MEFAQAAKGLGVKAIHGAEVDLDDGRHLTLLVDTQEGWRSLCRIITRAHAHTRDHGEPPPAVPLETLEEHAAGLVCLSGCARQGVHDEPTLRRLLAAFGRDGLRVELQRPFQRDDRARNRRLAELAERLGVAAVATGNVHAHALARAPLQDAFVALRNHTTLDASEPLRRGNTAHVLASPEAMARALRGPSAGGRRGGCARRAAALRPHRRPRLPLPGRGGRDGDRLAGRAVLVADRRALSRRQPAPRRRARPAGGGAARDRRARPRRLLHPAPRPAGAGARGRGAGARRRTRRARCCRRGAGAAPRCPRSSATSPASRTSTRSPTTCSSGASSTRS